MSELSVLVRSRGTIKQKLTILEKFINTIKTSSPDTIPNFSHVERRLIDSSILLADFDNVQSTIEAKCEEKDLDNHYVERGDFCDRFYAAQDFLSQWLQNAQPFSENSNAMPQTNRGHFDPLQNILLPKIKLPTFSGEFSQWINFKNNFTSTISNNPNLTTCQKFQFLKAALEGYALRIIEGLENTDNAFENAWEVLTDRFDKKQFLLDSHFKSILDIQSIHKENYIHFRRMLDETSKHLSALDALKLTRDELYDSFMIHILSSKLDKNTIRDWKEVKYQKDLPALKEFIDFLKNKSDLLQSLDHSQCNVQHKNNFSSQKNHVHMNLALSKPDKTTIVCNYCKKGHTIYKCPEFLNLTIESRIGRIKSLNLCENCLLAGHDKNSCKLGNCRICKVGKHNSLLHKEVSNTSSTNSHSNTLNMLVRPSSSNSVTKIGNSNLVLLSTIICRIKDKSGKLHMCRALLDCGAQSNLITEKCATKLNIPLSKTNISIMGINQTISQLNKACNVELSSKVTNYHCTISCLVVPTITDQIPSCHFNTSTWNLPSNIKLADPEFEIPREVDLLLGANIFWDLLLNGKITLGKNLPTLQNTLFGWVVTGSVPINSHKSICNFAKIHIPEDEQLKKFWQLEEINDKNSEIMSREDSECEYLFDQETFRADNGQFVVKLPLKHSPDVLGDSKENAVQRFKSLERKFSNEQFRQLYFDFIHEYKDLGHMSEISYNPKDSCCYFLPHHGVMKEASVTTKLRTVFDGSCKSSSGWSLNDLQYTGPKVQNEILDIILRFRIHKYVVSSDISKMYRQILMHPDHRSLHQILWRESSDDDFKIYQLNTVTYGTRAAPYLAIKCLNKLAIDNFEQFPDAAQTILNDMYVDDLLTGSNDRDELKTRCQTIYSILKTAGFILRKWLSNETQIISNFATSDISNSVLNIGDQDSCKTLGIQWFTQSDSLKYTIKQLNTQPTIITKRYILSIIAQIYDPLGLLSPSIILPKILIQRLWSLHISWDAPVPPEIEQTWLKFQKDLQSLNTISIPRSVIHSDYTLLDIHCFCDASQNAYATCIYLRSINNIGRYYVQLLCSKTKVAPLKTITIPKLELCACLLGAKLINTVKSAIKLQVPVFMWSDSQVALCWINTEPSQLQVFVANRVSKIQSLTSVNEWKYIDSKNNPADLASRGVFPTNLISNQLWFSGPTLLQKSATEWPTSEISLKKSELPELKKNIKIFNAINLDNFELFSRYSDYMKLKRVTAYCIRFINNIRNKASKQFGPLTIGELENSNNILVKIAQRECFASEVDILKKNKNIEQKHKLSSLAIFLDDKGILRVGGRLKNTYLPFNSRHPILLSSKHPFSKLLFAHKHKVLLHPGPQLLLSSIRQFYWIVGGRILARKTVKDCITCFKFNPSFCVSPMSSLPNDRITPRLPFEVTGIDYAGPFSILNKKGRGAHLIKCYLAVFVCFCTKAVHLEIVSDLTTENFLACLKRFMSRRGIPSVIYSDNGSTFVGASNELRALGQFLIKNQNSIVDSTSTFNLKWNFIVPYTPNHGGLWESAVKSAKYFIKRALINNNVTYDEFYTLVVQVEGILNSRPLFAMSNDPNDISPITPSHFLIGRVLNSLPDHDVTTIDKHRLTRWQHVQKLYQQFWTQFSKHYISQLHQQYKWKEAPSKLTEGTLVLIKYDSQPPCRWPLGRVVKLHPGKDGVSRIAELRTPKGTITRSVRHLCPLPLQDEIDN